MGSLFVETGGLFLSVISATVRTPWPVSMDMEDGLGPCTVAMVDLSFGE